MAIDFLFHPFFTSLYCHVCSVIQFYPFNKPTASIEPLWKPQDKKGGGKKCVWKRRKRRDTMAHGEGMTEKRSNRKNAWAKKEIWQLLWRYERVHRERTSMGLWPEARQHTAPGWKERLRWIGEHRLSRMRGVATEHTTVASMDRSLGYTVELRVQGTGWLPMLPAKMPWFRDYPKLQHDTKKKFDMHVLSLT